MKILLTTALFITATIASAFAGPAGTWLARNGKADVVVTQCKTGLCAKIIAVKLPYKITDKDKFNKNPGLKSRNITDMPLFVTMRPTGKDTWEGQVYDPEKGENYRGFVKQISKNILKVQGCLSVGWPCETYMWQRIK